MGGRSVKNSDDLKEDFAVGEPGKNDGRWRIWKSGTSNIQHPTLNIEKRRIGELRINNKVTKERGVADWWIFGFMDGFGVF